MVVKQVQLSVELKDFFLTAIELDLVEEDALCAWDLLAHGLRLLEELAHEILVTGLCCGLLSS